MPTQYSFSDALNWLKSGGRVSRHSWGSKMWLKLQVPDENSKMSLPYIYKSNAYGELVPYVAVQEDLLANDWEHLGDYYLEVLE